MGQLLYSGGPVTRSSEINSVIVFYKQNPNNFFTYLEKNMEHHVYYHQLFILSVIDTDSVEVKSTPDTINLCDNNNNSNNQPQVTCRISKENVNPEPTFSFSSDGLKFDSPSGTVSDDRSYYQNQFCLSPDVGGEYQVTCRVTNTVLNTWQDKVTTITFRSELFGVGGK